MEKTLFPQKFCLQVIARKKQILSKNCRKNRNFNKRLCETLTFRQKITKKKKKLISAKDPEKNIEFWQKIMRETQILAKYRRKNEDSVKKLWKNANSVKKS